MTKTWNKELGHLGAPEYDVDPVLSQGLGFDLGLGPLARRC